MELSEKQECWKGHEQALITTIRKETKRTEKLEEAGYRSPTWAVLRALQQINSATRIAMSAPPFFESAGQGDLLFWEEKEGPCYYQNKKMKVCWKRQARCTTGLCGTSQKKGRRKSAHLSSAEKKSSLTKMKRNRKRKIIQKTGAKGI